MLRSRSALDAPGPRRAVRPSRVAFLAIVVLCVVGGEPARTDERPSDGTASAAAQVDTGAERSGETKPGAGSAPASQMTPEKRQSLASAGIVLLAGIVCVGLLLMGVVLLLGRRIRRIARAPVPSCSAPDELWYLRTRQRAEEILRQAPPPRDASADDETLPA